MHIQQISLCCRILVSVLLLGGVLTAKPACAETETTAPEIRYTESAGWCSPQVFTDSAGLKTYGYDDAFRITGITDTTNAALSWTYGYDDLDRLTSASKAGTTLGYSYDANGNRLAQTGSGAATFTVAANSNRLTSTAGALARTYGYDNAGNTTSFTGVSFTYDNRGRMKSSTKNAVTTSYLYNALGQRVKKGGSSTTLFVYDDAGHLLGEYIAAGPLIQETLWLGDIPVATHI